MNKKILILIGVVAYILSSAVSYAYFSKTVAVEDTGEKTDYISPLGEGNEEEIAKESSEPATEECPMNGKLYPVSSKEKWEQRRPLGIMVENHKDSRPQSGLNSADITYEAVAEGGITRFLNIFYCSDAKPVGPVRSARIYFIRLLQEYGQFPLYAHVGGANKDGKADALGEIKKLKWFAYSDMDPLYGMSFPYFWRDYERIPNTDTEHTMYTDTAKLWDYAAKKRKLTNVDEDGESWDAKFVKWKFKDEAEQNKRGSVGSISFGFWDQFASDYSVAWKYNAKNNIYYRENGGAEHKDKNTGKPMEAKNLVVVLAKESVVNDGYEHGQHLYYDILKTGNGYLFQNGQAEKIKWSKKDGYTRMTFTDSKGAEVEFVRGKIFIEILPLENQVTY